jgi:hypothetical protein
MIVKKFLIFVFLLLQSRQQLINLIFKSLDRRLCFFSIGEGLAQFLLFLLNSAFVLIEFKSENFILFSGTRYQVA